MHLSTGWQVAARRPEEPSAGQPEKGSKGVAASQMPAPAAGLASAQGQWPPSPQRKRAARGAQEGTSLNLSPTLPPPDVKGGRG